MKNTEIELKFLLPRHTFESMIENAYKIDVITQGYLSYDPARCVRVRIVNDDVCYLTIKGIADGIVRNEIENEIALEQAKLLMNMALGKIKKLRYHLNIDGIEWVFDRIPTDDEEILLCEVEFDDIKSATEFRTPYWCGADVSTNNTYSNMSIVQYGGI